MSRFLVFDDATAAAVHKVGGDTQAVVDADVPAVIADAVHQQQTVVLVVPAGPNSATVARITPPAPRRNGDEA
jgi:hypothetical protein